MKIGKIDNKFNAFHCPVMLLKFGTCKNIHLIMIKEQKR